MSSIEVEEKPFLRMMASALAKIRSRLLLDRVATFLSVNLTKGTVKHCIAPTETNLFPHLITKLLK